MPPPGVAAPDIEASCAICGAPPYPECPHEGERLKFALKQAEERWAGVQNIRDWVLNNAKYQIISTFQQMKALRYQAHTNYLQTLPCYTLYQTYHGNPPLLPQQLQLLQHQINNANAILKQGVDEDWRRSCLRYPEVLDYYFGLVEISWPEERDSRMREPRFGKGGAEQKRVKGRESVEAESERERRRGKRRDSGRRTPEVPEPGRYRR